jgi:hypothetical protein
LSAVVTHLATKVLCSNGALAAKVHASVIVRPSAPEPPHPAERVELGHPRRVPTARSGSPRGDLGPRVPEQRTLVPAESPAVDLPDDRSAREAQRVFIDPELAAKWRAEATQDARQSQEPE